MQTFNPARLEPTFTSVPPFIDPLSAFGKTAATFVKQIVRDPLLDSTIEKICQIALSMPQGAHYRYKKDPHIPYSFFIASRKENIFVAIAKKKILYPPFANFTVNKEAPSKVRSAIGLKFTRADKKLYLDTYLPRFVLHLLKLKNGSERLAAARIDAAVNLADIEEILQPWTWGQFTGKGLSKFVMLFPGMDGSLFEYTLKFENLSKQERLHTLALVAFHIGTAIYKMHTHPKQYSHRDIKPENILLNWSEEGHVEEAKLIDFDLCCTNQPGDPRRLDTPGTFILAAPELHILNPLFHWPEYKTKSEISKKADILPPKLDFWNIGLTLEKLDDDYPLCVTECSLLRDAYWAGCLEPELEKKRDNWRGSIKQMEHIPTLDAIATPHQRILHFIVRCTHPYPKQRPEDKDLLDFTLQLGKQFGFVGEKHAKK